jgi:hypothetical protein
LQQGGDGHLREVDVVLGDLLERLGQRGARQVPPCGGGLLDALALPELVAHHRAGGDEHREQHVHAVLLEPQHEVVVHPALGEVLGLDLGEALLVVGGRFHRWGNLSTRHPPRPRQM